jgi:uncharacterized membrane protein
MRALAVKLIDRLRESYWFIPAIMALAALVLAATMIWIDSRVGTGWMDGISWLYAARPSGARSLLSAIGGSMVTVAGTVFSITIAAVVYASGQYGPRLLSNFMEDRGNQVTLGTFIATFLYCMVVLRTIRSPGESGGGAGAFVPQLAVLVAVALMLASVAVLIFFIHHVPTRIHINNVIERIGTRLFHGIAERFPRHVGQPLDMAEPPALPAGLRDGHVAGQVSGGATGYVQLVDEQALIDVARRYDMVVRIERRPGDFVHADDALAHLSREDAPDDALAAVRRAFSVGPRRSPTQDVAFLVDELGEIAARALSPGVNDPFTAMTCLDWMGAAFADLAGRPTPSRFRADEDGVLRVVACPISFSDLVEEGCGRLAPYAASDRNAAMRYLEMLARVAARCSDQARRTQVKDLGARFLELAADKLNGEPLERVRARGRLLAEVMLPAEKGACPLTA